MPTSKVCGQCASCGRIFGPGEIAIFFGTIKISKDKPEPGMVTCAYRTGVICRVSHLQSGERCAICQVCWANIKSEYFRPDTKYTEVA